MAPTAQATIKRILRRCRRSFLAFTRNVHLLQKSSDVQAPTRISHIHCLPPEILSIVFLHLLPEFGAPGEPEGVPTVLGQVCNRWRALTFTIPALWASFNITCTFRILHPPVHIIHTHLLHSASHPLSIALNTYGPRSSTGVPHLHFPAVVAALVTACDRWRHISFKQEFNSFTQEFNEMIQETLDTIAQRDTPLLQSFHYTVNGTAFLGMPSLHALQRCPRLESLTWRTTEAPMNLGLGNNTWPQLTTLNLGGALAASDCLTLLRLSPRLSTAIFGSINCPGGATSHHVLHATLHTLLAVGAYAAALIDALTLPVLTELSLSTHAPLVGHHTALPNLLIRSIPPLHKLSLVNLNLPEAVLLHVLALANGLRTLSVIDFSHTRVPLSAALIAALRPSPLPGPPPLCPDLNSLWLDSINAPDGACATMLRARWGAEARDNRVTDLREARLVTEGGWHGCDEAAIDVLNEEGMKGTVHMRCR